jgi:hypothetical protein
MAAVRGSRSTGGARGSAVGMLRGTQRWGLRSRRKEEDGGGGEDVRRQLRPEYAGTRVRVCTWVMSAREDAGTPMIQGCR